jgi:hypothetical protein
MTEFIHKTIIVNKNNITVAVTIPREGRTDKIMAKNIKTVEDLVENILDKISLPKIDCSIGLSAAPAPDKIENLYPGAFITDVEIE